MTVGFAGIGTMGSAIAANLLRVVAGEDGGSRRPAAGRVVELGEAQAAGRETIKIGRFDFAAVATQIAVAQVVGQNEQEIRRRFGFGRAGNARPRRDCREKRHREQS